jgi:hypothetical protein
MGWYNVGQADTSLRPVIVVARSECWCGWLRVFEGDGAEAQAGHASRVHSALHAYGRRIEAQGIQHAMGAPGRPAPEKPPVPRRYVPRRTRGMRGLALSSETSLPWQAQSTG